MLNHNKRLIKSKSKILLLALCIFGLLFSYSCNCRNNSTAPDNTEKDPPNTFSIGEKTDNVKASIIQSAKVIGDIKIGFDATHAYTLEYAVEDNETDETKKLDNSDFTKSLDNVLTLNNTAADKIRKWESSSAPAEKTITINFTLKANDPNLKNSTQTLSVEVTLTHAQKVENNQAKTFMEGILRAGQDVLETDNNPGGEHYTFLSSEGTFDTVSDTFTINHKDGDNWAAGIPYSRIYTFTDYNFNKEKNVFSGKLWGTRSGAGELSQDKKSFTITYDVTFDDKYEVSISQVKVKLEIKNDKLSFKDDTTQP